MNMFLKVTSMEWKLNNRNFMNVFFALFFPVMMLLLFGTIFTNEPNEMMGGFGTVDSSVPGYICMVMAVTGLMTLPLTLAQYRQSKILKRFMVTPLKPIDILLSQLIVNTLTTFAGVLLLIITGILIFDLSFYGNVFEATLAFMLILASVFAIGLFIASISKNIKTATAISYIIYFPMLFLSGASMPLEIMPESIKNISKILPLTYGVRLNKGIWLGGHLTDYYFEIGILLFITVIFGFLSLRLFKWE